MHRYRDKIKGLSFMSHWQTNLLIDDYESFLGSVADFLLQLDNLAHLGVCERTLGLH